MQPIWGPRDRGLVNWALLRSVGNVGILKISYLALAATPFLTKFKAIGRYLNLYDTDIILATFFAGILLGAANLLYDIKCPVIIKRFDSPNDLYKDMLQIKALQLTTYPNDAFQADYEHCRSAYRRLAVSDRAYGISCAILYGFSALLFLFILLDRIVTVIKDLF
jgi:hypothetical protein